jgi:hypothetical protein
LDFQCGEDFTYFWPSIQNTIFNTNLSILSFSWTGCPCPIICNSSWLERRTLSSVGAGVGILKLK